jgi:hypothetical protein
MLRSTEVVAGSVYSATRRAVMLPWHRTVRQIDPPVFEAVTNRTDVFVGCCATVRYWAG